MRRVLAIGLAILIVMIASRGVVAQEDSVSDRLLEILKDRQIISNDEYGELKGLAAEMNADRADMDRRLGDLDRSIADYLAECGDAVSASTGYQAGLGFIHTSSDNLFSLAIGGLFNVAFMAVDGERNPEKYLGSDRDFDFDDLGYHKRDTTNIGAEARFHFLGHAFVPELEYYFEFIAGSSYAYVDRYVGDGYYSFIDSGFDYGRSLGGVALYEGYVDYDLCGWTNIRAGQFRKPFGRQNLIHASDLHMYDRAISAPMIDVGLMAFNMYEDVFGVDGLDAEYMLGVFDGVFASGDSWLSPAMRLAVYPLGAIPYVEGDWTASGDPRFGIGASYVYDRGRLSTGHEYAHAWGVDFVMTWSGLYLTGEWHRYKYDRTGGSSYSASSVYRNWFVQAGFMVMPAELEIFLRYAKFGTPSNSSSGSMLVTNGASYSFDNQIEWAAGATYYFEGHHLKVTVQIVSFETEFEDGSMSSGRELDDLEQLGIIIGFQLEW